jgi:hypothetical protein
MLLNKKCDSAIGLVLLRNCTACIIQSRNLGAIEIYHRNLNPTYRRVVSICDMILPLRSIFFLFFLAGRSIFHADYRLAPIPPDLKWTMLSFTDQASLIQLDFFSDLPFSSWQPFILAANKIVGHRRPKRVAGISKTRACR